MASKKELDAITKNVSLQAGAKRRQPTITEEEKAQRKAEGRTSGREGAKMDRINMAFTSDNFEYIKIMSKLKGQTMTQFCNWIITEHREKNEALFEQAKELGQSIK